MLEFWLQLWIPTYLVLFYKRKCLLLECLSEVRLTSAWDFTCSTCITGKEFSINQRNSNQHRATDVFVSLCIPKESELKLQKILDTPEVVVAWDNNLQHAKPYSFHLSLSHSSIKHCRAAPLLSIRTSPARSS